MFDTFLDLGWISLLLVNCLCEFCPLESVSSVGIVFLICITVDGIKICSICFICCQSATNYDYVLCDSFMLKNYYSENAACLVLL